MLEPAGTPAVVIANVTSRRICKSVRGDRIVYGRPQWIIVPRLGGSLGVKREILMMEILEN